MLPTSSALRHSLPLRSAVALVSVIVALLLRWALDPILKDNLPLVTLFGAVAISVWHARWRIATIAAVLGFAVASYLFIPPRNEIAFGLAHLVFFISYATSCAIIIYFGERVRRAHDRVFSVSQSRDQIEDSLVREKELLATTLASIGDAVIVTSPEARILSLNSEA